MKSLVFNLMVVGALGFLLFDGKPPKSVDEAMDKVTAKTEHLLEKGKKMVGTPAFEPEGVTQTPAQDRAGDEAVAVAVAPAPARPAAPVAQPVPTPAQATETEAAETKPAPAKTMAPVQTVKTQVVEAAPAAPARAAAAMPDLDPAVAKRRAEILGTAPQNSARETEPSRAFMAPPVRRAELQRLAEDMELLFVEKANR
jgi:hypothetical protein